MAAVSGFQHRPVRGIGEPIWPGRRPEEILESHWHEARLNVAVDPEIPFWLVCPYDAEALSPAVIEGVHRSHPVIVDAVSYQGSADYAGRARAESMFVAELPDLVGPSIATAVSAHNVDRLQTYIRPELVAGLPDDEAARLAVASLRLALSSLHRGATEGTVRIWSRRNAVICEVADRTTIDDLLPCPLDLENDGLWHANQICDPVQTSTYDQAFTRRNVTFRAIQLLTGNAQMAGGLSPDAAQTQSVRHPIRRTTAECLLEQRTDGRRARSHRSTNLGHERHAPGDAQPEPRNLRPEPEQRQHDDQQPDHGHRLPEHEHRLPEHQRHQPHCPAALRHED